VAVTLTPKPLIEKLMLPTSLGGGAAEVEYSNFHRDTQALRHKYRVRGVSKGSPYKARTGNSNGVLKHRKQRALWGLGRK